MPAAPPPGRHTPGYRLGREKDPRVPGDIGPAALLFRKVLWTVATLPGLRFMVRLIYRRSTISHCRVNGAVAFTIDDGFCGRDNPGGCMLEEVRQLFKDHGARASFFLTGSHCAHTSKDDVQALLEDGHELINHNMMDRPYNRETAQAFEGDLRSTEMVLSQYRDEVTRWYRAPFGRLSETMRSVLDSQDLTHVLCDCFANDTAIPDPEWIAKFILRRVKDGSIVLIHMPERGCREWNFQAMKRTLEGLAAKGLKVVTFSELYRMQAQDR